jgi:hypothetical protein
MERKSDMLSRLDGKKKEIDTLEVNNIVVDYGIQQPLYENRVREILSQGYDPALAGEICISRRVEKIGRKEVITDVVLDGMHRLEAAKRSGFPYVDAEVWYELSYEDECWLFAYRNRKHNPMPVFTFRARLNSEEQVPVAINEVLTGLGWHLSNVKNQPSQFAAVNTAEQIYSGKGRFKSKKLGEGDLFRETMRVITTTWGHHPSASDAQVISAMAVFLARYREQIDTKKLVESLGRMTVDLFRAEMNATKKSLDISPSVAGALIIHREYNKRARSRKLAPFALS